ncbi:MAG: hypothetical protein IPN08_10870 [Bacteroidales bacterium]|nr:hypothetical protein [Bacteroidales bacterium]
MTPFDWSRLVSTSLDHHRSTTNAQGKNDEWRNTEDLMVKWIFLFQGSSIVLHISKCLNF